MKDNGGLFPGPNYIYGESDIKKATQRMENVAGLMAKVIHGQKRC